MLDTCQAPTLTTQVPVLSHSTICVTSSNTGASAKNIPATISRFRKLHSNRLRPHAINRNARYPVLSNPKNFKKL